MGLSHFLPLPFLHGDKTLGTQLRTERSSCRRGGAGPGRAGLQARPRSSDPGFPIFPIACDLSFLSPHCPQPFSASLLLCTVLMHLGSLPAGVERGCLLLPAHSPPLRKLGWGGRGGFRRLRGARA
uniref:Uncharacterized protein n=1 Tax=Ailuropoda melanoleuca TaxID=9646 RepID=A0A7N5P7Q1_AILME